MANKDYITDELLAAYLDGNTTEEETRQVLNALKNDPKLREVVETALSADVVENLSFDILPMSRIAAESGSNICSVLCEAYVLHRRGISFDEKELLDLAAQVEGLRPEGTPLHAIGQLLVHYGLMITHSYDATFDDVEKALSLDNDVLVVVDSDKLHPSREDKEDVPNHAIVITAIDSQEKSITIYDPQENAQYTIAFPIFENAWKESQHYMVQVLQTIDDYEPQPINLDEIQLTSDLLDLREAIAENAHDIWAKARIKDGWTYGPERDDVHKKHPDLIPYSALPDGEKEYDRLMALDTIRLVKKLGFDIVKR